MARLTVAPRICRADRRVFRWALPLDGAITSTRNHKWVPTKAAAAAATGPRPSTLVELLDQCRCGRGTTSAMRKGTSPWPHDVNVLDHVQPDHRERRHEEVKSRPFCCRVVVRFRLGLCHEHASARLTSGPRPIAVVHGWYRAGAFVQSGANSSCGAARPRS